MVDPEVIETDSQVQLLTTLTHLNEISASINRLWGDPTAVKAALHLIAESAADIVPGASVALYTYNPTLRSFALAAGAHTTAEASVPSPLACLAVEELRPVLSYEEPALRPAAAGEAKKASQLERSAPPRSRSRKKPRPTQAGVTPPEHQPTAHATEACVPLVVGKEAAGVLCLQAPDERRLSQLDLLLLNSFVNQAASAVAHSGQLSDVQRDLARKEDELHRLRHAGLLISSRTRLDDTLVAILEMALEVTGAKYGIFRLVDRETNSLIMRAIAGEQLGRPAVEALPINATSIMGLVAKLRQPLCIADVRDNPWSRIYYPLDHSLEMRSELAVPLIGASGRLEGVLNLESPVVGTFSEEDSLLLQSLATQAVIAIQEVRLLDALQGMAERLLAQPLQQVLDHLAELACDLLNVGASAVWTLDGEQLSLAAASAGHVHGQSLPLHGSLTGQAILSRGPVESEDVRSDPRFAWADLARSQRWKRALVVPLLASDGEPVGAFNVYGTEQDGGQAASDWDKKVLTILAHYAALAVRHASDQTALRAAEQQRVAAETFAALGDIAANLLHQLNNRIGTIPVRVEGIEDKSATAIVSDPYLAANLEEIGQSAREAMDGVRETLSHLQVTQPGPVSVAACVAEAIKRSRVAAGVEVRTTGLGALPPVLAGQHGLTLVFTNLLENASDAMSGKGQIEIDGRATKDWVEVTVCDSGPGIAPELHESIFELSFSGRRGSHSGELGFGLWWVKTWMTRLGGSITVESDGQRGTCFRLRLPPAEEPT